MDAIERKKLEELLKKLQEPNKKITIKVEDTLLIHDNSGIKYSIFGGAIITMIRNMLLSDNLPFVKIL